MRSQKVKRNLGEEELETENSAVNVCVRVRAHACKCACVHVGEHMCPCEQVSMEVRVRYMCAHVCLCACVM